MTDKKKGSRLGFDPLAGKDEHKGIDGLIRATGTDAHTEPITQTAQKIPGKKGEHGGPLPRINMAFTTDHLDYLRTMAAAQRISVTRYIYNLVESDRQTKGGQYNQIKEIMEGMGK